MGHAHDLSRRTQPEGALSPSDKSRHNSSVGECPCSANLIAFQRQFAGAPAATTAHKINQTYGTQTGHQNDGTHALRLAERLLYGLIIIPSVV